MSCFGAEEIRFALISAAEVPMAQNWFFWAHLWLKELDQFQSSYYILNTSCTLNIFLYIYYIHIIIYIIYIYGSYILTTDVLPCLRDEPWWCRRLSCISPGCWPRAPPELPDESGDNPCFMGDLAVYVAMKIQVSHGLMRYIHYIYMGLFTFDGIFMGFHGI
jgi:hypothetical protein